MNDFIGCQHNQQTFASIRQQDTSGNEFWFARDLQPLLEYATWNKFKRVIEKAMKACCQSGHDPDDHFSRLGKMVGIGSGAPPVIPASTI